MTNTDPRWTRVITALSRQSTDNLAEQRELLLQDALGVGASITDDTMGCSITETRLHGFRTPAASSSTALELDLAQYAADDGPCIAACRDGQSHSIIIMTEEPQYAEFTAAAARHGVRSSLSLPLTGATHASALNLYASSTSAFESEHARAVAGLLARCVAALLPGSEVPRAELDLAAAMAKNAVVQRACRALQTTHGFTPAQAFLHMTQLSRTEQRSIHAIAQDISNNPAASGQTP
jgi:hypothetical protein